MTKVNELVQLGQNLDFKIRRDHEKNFLWKISYTLIGDIITNFLNNKIYRG